MRKVLFFIFIIFFPLSTFSQNLNEQKIASAIKILKIHQSSLDQLSPFEEEGMEQIDRLNRKVSEKLLEILNMPEIVVFPKDSIPFFTGQSADRNFAVFSWAENLGGSFKTMINIFYWKNKNGLPIAQEINIEDNPAGYGNVIEIKNKNNETLYFLLGGGITCNTCRLEKALLYKIGKEDLEEIFSFQIDYRFYNDIPGFSFDQDNQILNYEYIEDECEDDVGENCWIRGKFKFDGITFQEIE